MNRRAFLLGSAALVALRPTALAAPTGDFLSLEVPGRRAGGAQEIDEFFRRDAGNWRVIRIMDWAIMRKAEFAVTAGLDGAEFRARGVDPFTNEPVIETRRGAVTIADGTAS